MKKAAREWCVGSFNVQVLFVCTCAWELMCLLRLVCRLCLCGMLSEFEAHNENFFFNKFGKLNSHGVIDNEMTQ